MKDKKIVVFLAGRYRSPEGGTDGIFENLYLMRSTYKRLISMGYTVVCPNLSSAFMDGFITDYEDFIEGTKEVMSRCDVVFFNEGWHLSNGCIDEMIYALELKLPIIVSRDDETESTFYKIINEQYDNTSICLKFGRNIKKITPYLKIADEGYPYEHYHKETNKYIYKNEFEKANNYNDILYYRFNQNYKDKDLYVDLINFHEMDINNPLYSYIMLEEFKK